ncbi:MAG: hypothetical protein II114_08870 [Treponema sp.]|nr:hypothetical protein [Treponema sp.]MBQ4235370.1 hypothetical protein [Treponema sp.]
MVRNTSTAVGGDAWYAYDGVDDDVFVSSTVCFARNLANFPFPSQLRGNDGERIQSLVFDAFNSLSDGEKYQALSVNRLDPLGTRILQEREILSDSASEKKAGVIVRSDGKITCSVNMVDHVRISSFAPGFDFNGPMSMAENVDKGLQTKLQFAASYDFGYLTSTVEEAGSGIKFSVRMHLPSLTASGKIPSLTRAYNDKGLSFTDSFGSGGSDQISGIESKSGSLGSFYDLKTSNCLSGTELDQMANIVSAATRFRDYERSARDECRKNMDSTVRNAVFRSVALARSSVFIRLREAVSLISGVKWGLDLGIIEGIDDTTLRALLYRIQEGHLEYVLKSGNFIFEKDIKNDAAKKIERIRAVILQEAFDNIKISR